MNMRQLEAFRAVFRTGSVSGGAEILHTSQPSLSRVIGDLEASVGFALFTRGRRGMVPTAEGRRFHEAVERSFVGIDRLRDTARVIAETRDGELNIGVIPSLAQSVLPVALSKLQAIHPMQRIHITVGTAPTIINAVLLNNIDVGVVGTSITLEDVEILFETQFDGICLVPAGHRLAKSTAPIDLLELEHGDYVSYDRPLLEAMQLPSELVDRMLSHAMITSHSTPTLVAIAQATLKLAIVDQLATDMTGLTHGMIDRKIVQRPRHGLAVIKRHGQPLSDPATEFVRAFQLTTSIALKS